MFAAISRASSFVSSLAAASPVGQSLATLDSLDSQSI